MDSALPCNSCGSHNIYPACRYSSDESGDIQFWCGGCNPANNIQQQQEQQRLALKQQRLALEQQQFALEQQQQQLALEQQQLALKQQRQQKVALQPASGATRLVLDAVTPTGVAFRAMTSEDVFAARNSAQPRLIQGYIEPSGQSICNAYREQDARQNSNVRIRWAPTNISPQGGYPFLNR